MKNNKGKITPESDTLQASSCQDFTGLIPAGPVDETELQDYEELFPFYPKIPRHTKE